MRRADARNAFRRVLWGAAALSLAAASVSSGGAGSAELQAYTETIPGTTVTFEMVALRGGTYSRGSPDSEAGRKPDEGPQHSVEIAPFWIGKTEVTWDEYEQYYFGGGTPLPEKSPDSPDAITRPTPPYGAPDLGWGRGKRPAISMTWHAANEYCRWLSALTGKKYRLPTEAEWEYAARAGSTTSRYYGEDPAQLGEYAWFSGNSKFQTHPAASLKPNAWGLYDMLGNVAEFCSGYYSAEDYAGVPAGQAVRNPSGPESGDHRVVRGGSYLNPASRLRSAARERTYHTEWLYTDPQEPKSVWWYSDCFFVGFRVVRSP